MLIGQDWAVPLRMRTPLTHCACTHISLELVAAGRQCARSDWFGLSQHSASKRVHSLVEPALSVYSVVGWDFFSANLAVAYANNSTTPQAMQETACLARQECCSARPWVQMIAHSCTSLRQYGFGLWVPDPIQLGMGTSSGPQTRLVKSQIPTDCLESLSKKKLWSFN